MRFGCDGKVEMMMRGGDENGSTEEKKKQMEDGMAGHLGSAIGTTI